MTDRACARCAHLFDEAELIETADYRMLCGECADLHIADAIEKATARKMAADAELAELKLACERGDLITIADAMQCEDES